MGRLVGTSGVRARLLVGDDELVDGGLVLASWFEPGAGDKVRFIVDAVDPARLTHAWWQIARLDRRIGPINPFRGLFIPNSPGFDPNEKYDD